MLKKYCIKCGKIFFKKSNEGMRYWNTKRFCSLHCSLLGRPGYWKGKKLSQETLKKMSIANIGRIPWSKGLNKVTNKSIAIIGKKSGLARLNKPRKPFRLINGYKYIFQPFHPLAEREKVVPEQVLIMEKHIGRFLNKQEVVHHINFNKLDNRIENLKLFPNKNEHMRFHCKFFPNDGIKKGHKISHIVKKITREKISKTLKARFKNQIRSSRSIQIVHPFTSTGEVAV